MWRKANKVFWGKIKWKGSSRGKAAKAIKVQLRCTIIKGVKKMLADNYFGSNETRRNEMNNSVWKDKGIKCRKIFKVKSEV